LQVNEVETVNRVKNIGVWGQDFQLSRGQRGSGGGSSSAGQFFQK